MSGSERRRWSREELRAVVDLAGGMRIAREAKNGAEEEKRAREHTAYLDEVETEGDKSPWFELWASSCRRVWFRPAHGNFSNRKRRPPETLSCCEAHPWRYSWRFGGALLPGGKSRSRKWECLERDLI